MSETLISIQAQNTLCYYIGLHIIFCLNYLYDTDDDDADW